MKYLQEIDVDGKLVMFSIAIVVYRLLIGRCVVLGFHSAASDWIPSLAAFAMASILTGVTKGDEPDTDSDAVDLEQLESQTKYHSSAWSQRYAADEMLHRVWTSRCLVVDRWLSGTDATHNPWCVSLPIDHNLIAPW